MAVRRHPSSRSRRGAKAAQIFHAVQGDFGQSSRVVFFVMAGAMAVAAVVALVGLRGGRQADLPDATPSARRQSVSGS